MTKAPLLSGRGFCEHEGFDIMSKNGQKLQSAAIIIGTIEIIIVIIVGALLWMQLKGWIGFLCFFGIAGLGGLYAYAQMMLLSCVGELTDLSARQLDILKSIKLSASAKKTPTQSNKMNTNDNASEANEHDDEAQSLDSSEDTLQKDFSKSNAYFTSRSLGQIECPMCGKKQSTKSNHCIICSCNFVFKDE